MNVMNAHYTHICKGSEILFSHANKTLSECALMFA